jgi:phage-related minor tail protein
MNILEMFTDKLPSPERQIEKDDNTAVKLSNLRKTKVTLKQLNRLRIMNDVRKLEHEQDLEHVRKQYKAPPAQPVM